MIEIKYCDDVYLINLKLVSFLRTYKTCGGEFCIVICFSCGVDTSFYYKEKSEFEEMYKYLKDNMEMIK